MAPASIIAFEMYEGVPFLFVLNGTLIDAETHQMKYCLALLLLLSVGTSAFAEEPIPLRSGPLRRRTC